MTIKKKEKQLTVNIPESLMKEFRKNARKKYGDERGYIKEAVIDAITSWNKQN
jgi:metal-responsive CopG/Arc/MetJ family transcriptional regulator